MRSLIPRPVRVIWRKELLETLRDRKTVVMMVILPLLLYPLIFLALGQATAMQVEALRSMPMRVGVGPHIDGPLRQSLEALEHTEILPMASDESLRRGVASGDIQAAVTSVTAQATSGEGTWELGLLYDGGSDASREAERRLKEAISAFGDDQLNARLARLNRPKSFVKPVAVDPNNVAPPQRQGGYLLGQILPMLISILMIGATFYPAIDLTAGEKERGTLQTLLTAPLTPLVIVAGKYLAVVTLALMTGLMNLASMAFVAMAIPLPADMASEISLSFGADVFFLVLLALVMLGMMFGAVMMAIAVTARSFKEAQNYLTPLYLVCIFPLLLSGLPGVQLTEVSATIPLINLALAIKTLLVDGAANPLLGIVFISTSCWIALSLVVAARVFNNEAVLLGHAGISALFARRIGRHASRPAVPTIGEIVVVLGTTLLFMFYGTLLLQGASLLVIIHATQWVFILTPAVVLVWWLRLDMRRTFRLYAPSASLLCAGFAAGLGSWVGAQWIVQGLFHADVLPVPSPTMEAFGRQLYELAQEPSTAIVLFLGVAVAPAVCEEMLFRGAVQSALLRNMRPASAIAIQAALFGVYHLNVYQAVPAGLVGLLLGGLVYKSGSLLPAVVMHALHNGLALAFQAYGQGPVDADIASLSFPLELLALLLGPLIAVVMMLASKQRSAAG